MPELNNLSGLKEPSLHVGLVCKSEHLAHVLSCFERLAYIALEKAGIFVHRVKSVKNPKPNKKHIELDTNSRFTQSIFKPVSNKNCFGISSPL